MKSVNIFSPWMEIWSGVLSNSWAPVPQSSTDIVKLQRSPECSPCAGGDILFWRRSDEKLLKDSPYIRTPQHSATFRRIDWRDRNIISTDIFSWVYKQSSDYANLFFFFFFCVPFSISKWSGVMFKDSTGAQKGRQWWRAEHLNADWLSQLGVGHIFLSFGEWEFFASLYSRQD